MLKNTLQITAIGIFLTLSGCAAKQQITGFQNSPPQNICVARHEAVRKNFHDALVESLERHQADVRTIRANYVEKHQAWNPTVVEENIDNCDAIAFYVANWTWDITMYMHYANIWLTDKEMSQKIAQATYQTGGGPDKWINAKEKVDELVDQMYQDVSGQAFIHNTNETKVVTE